MKKIMILVAAAAAVFGIAKLRGKKQEDEFGVDTVVPSNGYAPEPQP